MRRAAQGRLLGGVCAGAARHYRIDVSLLRLALLVLALAWGLGIVVYAAAWLVLPTEGEPRRRRGSRQRWAGLRGEVASLGDRLRQAWREEGRGRTWPRPPSRRWLALGLLVAGTLVLLASLGAFAWVTPLRALALATVAIGATLMVSLHG